MYIVYIRSAYRENGKMSNVEALRQWNSEAGKPRSKSQEVTGLESLYDPNDMQVSEATVAKYSYRRSSWRDTWAFPAYSSLPEIV